MKSITFTVPFVAGKGRPRFIRSTGRAYTPPKTIAAMKKIRQAFIDAGGKKAPRGVEVFLHVTTVRALPESRPKKVEHEPDVHKPDADNIGKLVADALNGYAYHDDAQVTDFEVKKCPRIRGMQDRTIIWVGWEESDE